MSRSTLLMLKKERAAYILQRMEELYPETPVPLDHSNHFTLLVAVLLSAQCTDKRVNLQTPALFKKANSAKKMLKLTVEEIDAIVRPCGLAPRKAQSIRGLSEILIEKHGGEVPPDMVALEELPGVGHKTASVVMSQAFGVPAFAVDTHIHRLAQRWKLTDGRSVTKTEADLKKLFPRDAWSKLHLQIIFYGREFCTARGCDGTVCPICRHLFPKRRISVIWKK
ncbi:endonuclease III [Akkermansiaceae bacterium]|nr:endonuclease III [Akkermansiaceae bacterium]MDB4732526.1 endonuclease III [Akkermansiaceae bacterium]MDB4804432.1 endonuclease III [Akkermansiaceae bacterium]MDC1285804.1 endonuclease III [Akkermansiaceae bacterium]